MLLAPAQLLVERADAEPGAALADLLIEVPDAAPPADLALAVEGRQLADQRLQQRRLAAAVRTDHAQLVAAIDVDGHAVEDLRARIADRQAGRADDLLAPEIAAGLEGEPNLAGVLPLVVRALETLQLLQHLAPALRLLGLLARQVAADEVLGLVDVLLLPFVFGLRALDPRGALDDVLVVAERVAGELAVLQLDDLVADRADEGAIVRHQHERPFVLGEIGLESLDGRQIEMVGRL